MLASCDVKCYWCGHLSGQLIVDRDAADAVPRYRPAPSNLQPPPAKGQRLRCGRCSGPVYLDGLQPVLEPRSMEGFRGRLRRPPVRKLAQAS